MPRRVQDIKPSERRTVRDIAPVRPVSPKINIKKIPPAAEEAGTRPFNNGRLIITPPEYKKPKAKRSRKRMWWVIAVVAAVLVVSGAGFLASAKLARATFSIMPVSRPVTVNAALVTDSKTGTDNLSYKTSDFSGAASTTVPAPNGPSVSVKAEGKVTIYNAYSASSQRLIAGTRLSGSSGLVYRLSGSVVIPGYTKSSSGAVIPGKTGATIVADQPGSEYNLSAAGGEDLRAVAYKGTARYDVIYARLATDISGGFLGVKKTVNPSLLASTTAALRDYLTVSILRKAKASVPKGRIFYDGSYVADFGQPQVSASDADNASVSLSGTIHAITFDRDELVAKLAGSETVNAFGGFSYDPRGLEELSFTLTDPKDFSTDGKKPLVVRFKGDMNLVGLPPVDELKEKLAGKLLTQTGTILRSYMPIIDINHSYGEITPSWISSVPTDLSRISVVIKPVN